MSNESSSNIPSIPPTSTANPTELQIWQKILADYRKPKTPAQIRAEGEVKTRITILWVVGITCGSLAIGGLVMFFYNPNHAEKLWAIIGPIITAGITGILVYLTGEKNSSKK